MNRATLVIMQGATWSMSWPVHDENGDPLDLSGWGARAQIRPTAGSDEVYHEFTVDAGNVTIDGNYVQLSTRAAESSAWSWNTGVYALELLAPDGRVARIAEGDVVLSREVTR